MSKQKQDNFDRKDKRYERVAVKQNLEKRKNIKDRHFYAVEDEDDEEAYSEYETFMKKGK